ncbi:hypothetical protein [Mesobacillus zeae]|uniref:Uncharacterized protein n=1 Tax=Mesobacillus zeae TaxID=1917180 RepID=A0A398B3D9_9BACI|nr:hypothetical protein [Mesobacillus zeae]RID83924.1 hypothetical protein D1970_15115 [Mesobacillus zeae]
MGVGFPVICYKKLVDGSEVQIGLFRSNTEAKNWAISNGIMSQHSAQKSLLINDYSETFNTRKYPNASQYRFKYADKKKYPEELFIVKNPPRPERPERKPRIVLYQKQNNGEEKIVAKFCTAQEAYTYAAINRIMSVGWVGKTVKENIYPTFKHKNIYPNAKDYRFAHIDPYDKG